MKLENFGFRKATGIILLDANYRFGEPSQFNILKYEAFNEDLNELYEITGIYARIENPNLIHICAIVVNIENGRNEKNPFQHYEHFTYSGNFVVEWYN